ncbi:MAG: hypothetical protein BIP78_1667 [Candidatus Bipolaricaulis sibiricus]|uniref:VCBS repeat-containing protein n=1 Tax=Bipolaricaulis sibiricus TaxID=2501609 RepID=A0A410FWS9_BIPS1|nr:MAG: hypothetical protein BIP78_1667 [Candidatus Bipolaricaulis sibiricus]
MHNGPALGTLEGRSVRQLAASILILVAVCLAGPSAWAFDLPKDWLPPALVTSRLEIGEPVGLLAGDFNGNGITDLMIITDLNRPAFFEPPSGDYAVRFFLLPGAEHGWQEEVLVGTFEAPGRYLFAHAIASGVDIDGDGNQDAVAVLTFAAGAPVGLEVDTLETHLVILWGDGHGSFGMDDRRVEAGLLPPLSILLGDLDGDGRVDLAYNDPQNLAIRVLYNQGGRVWSDPHTVEVVGPEGAPIEDECILIPMTCAIGRVDPTLTQDTVAVVGPCLTDQGDYVQALRFLVSCGEDCWDLSPLVQTGPVSTSFDTALGHILVGDVDRDGCEDVVFTRRIFLPEQGAALMIPPIMGVYLMPCVRRPGLEPPTELGAVHSGGFFFAKALLSVDRTPDGLWRIVAFDRDQNSVGVLHVQGESGGLISTSIPVRGVVVDGVTIERDGRREIVVVASLDLRSGVTLLNVVTRRSP